MVNETMLNALTAPDSFLAKNRPLIERFFPDALKPSAPDQISVGKTKDPAAAQLTTLIEAVWQRRGLELAGGHTLAEARANFDQLPLADRLKLLENQLNIMVTEADMADFVKMLK